MKLLFSIIFWLVPVSWLFTMLLSFFYYEIPPVLWWINGLGLLCVFVYYTFAKKMVLYVCQRLAGVFVTLLVIASLTFVLLRVLPGGPFDREKALPPEIKAHIEEKYQLNQPLFSQYVLYLKGLFKGQLGESYKYLNRNVTDIIADTWPVSFQLGIWALILSYLIGIPCGVLAATRRNTLTDRSAMICAISGVSLPSFLVAPLLILFFGFYLNWLEVAFWYGPSYYILPVVVLGVRPAAVLARLTRASVLEVMNADYVRTARAKGLNFPTVLYKHVLKNAFLPVLTFSGPLVAGVLTGSFIVEYMFALPGMAGHLVSSVVNRDYPLIIGVTLLYSLALVLCNLIVDLLYSYFDPRIHLSAGLGDG